MRTQSTGDTEFELTLELEPPATSRLNNIEIPVEIWWLVVRLFCLIGNKRDAGYEAA